MWCRKTQWLSAFGHVYNQRITCGIWTLLTRVVRIIYNICSITYFFSQDNAAYLSSITKQNVPTWVQLDRDFTGLYNGLPNGWAYSSLGTHPKYSTLPFKQHIVIVSPLLIPQWGGATDSVVMLYVFVETTVLYTSEIDKISKTLNTCSTAAETRGAFSRNICFKPQNTHLIAAVL